MQQLRHYIMLLTKVKKTTYHLFSFTANHKKILFYLRINKERKQIFSIQIIQNEDIVYNNSILTIHNSECIRFFVQKRQQKRNQKLLSDRYL